MQIVLPAYACRRKELKALSLLWRMYYNKGGGGEKQLRRLWHGWEAFRPGKGKIKVKGRNAEWIKTDIQSIAI